MWLKQVPASVCGLWLHGPLQVCRGPTALQRHLQVGGERRTAGETTKEKPVQKKKLVTQCCQLISPPFGRGSHVLSVCGCLRAGKQVVIALSRLLSLLTGREEKKMSDVLTGEGGGGNVVGAGWV